MRGGEKIALKQIFKTVRGKLNFLKVWFNFYKIVLHL